MIGSNIQRCVFNPVFSLRFDFFSARYRQIQLYFVFLTTEAALQKVVVHILDKTGPPRGTFPVQNSHFKSGETSSKDQAVNDETRTLCRS